MTAWPHLSETLPQLATVDDVAPFLGLGRDAILRRLRKGRLPGVRVGHRWLVKVEELRKLIEEGGKL